MPDAQLFEDRFARDIRSYAVAGAPRLRRDAIERAVAAGIASRRVGLRRFPWTIFRLPMLSRPVLVGIVILATIVGLAIGIGGKDKTARPSDRPATAPSPTAPVPSQNTTRSLPVLPTGVGEGWPGGLRPEAAGDPVVVGTTTTDPSGDVPKGDSYVDIVRIRDGYIPESVDFRLGGNPPSPVPDPRSNERIGYGAVIDLDADGTGDVRVGMENAVAAGEQLPWTMWISDLRTGESTACQCDTTTLRGHRFETLFPGSSSEGFGRLWLPGAFASNARFYVWASIAEGDQVQATDYAPDAGWLRVSDPHATPVRANPERPGPLRSEPAHGASEVRGSFDAQGSRIRDPDGDPTPQANASADITEVVFRQGCWRSLTTEACVFFSVADVPGRPLPDPAERWLAYGLVVDYDADGVGDGRYAIDNIADGRKQMWRTDLTTGVTEAARPGLQEDGVMDAVYPGDTHGSASMFVERDPHRPFRFYVWASAMDAEGNESTDFAPDSGWLAFEVKQ
jgi:hypothetical protein